MTLLIPVAHDFSCPWCWIGFHQIKQLEREFPVKFEWLSYELMPDDIPWDPPTPRPEMDPRRPATPSRLTLAYAAQGLEIPVTPRPKQMRTHNALESMEWAKLYADVDHWAEVLYRAHWEQGMDINDLAVLSELATRSGFDEQSMMASVRDKAFFDKIVKFDADAYATGVFNVPTFFIGGELFAEQPIMVIQSAIRSVIQAQIMA